MRRTVRMRSVDLWRWHNNVTMTNFVFIHFLDFYSETAICLVFRFNLLSWAQYLSYSLSSVGERKRERERVALPNGPKLLGSA
jgi:hypothetical protein